MPYRVDDPAPRPRSAPRRSGRRPRQARRDRARRGRRAPGATPRPGGSLRGRAPAAGPTATAGSRHAARGLPPRRRPTRGVLEKPFARQKIEPKLHSPTSARSCTATRPPSWRPLAGAGARPTAAGARRPTRAASAPAPRRWRGMRDARARARTRARAPAEWGDPHGPLVLGVAVVSFLATAWCAEVRAWLARA